MSDRLRRLGSPAGLFALWTCVLALVLLVPLVALSLAGHRHAIPIAHVARRRFDPRQMRLLGDAFTLYPLSFPVFALAYGSWKRAFGRSLAPGLGYLHFGLAVAPMTLGPIVAATAVGFAIAAHPRIAVAHAAAGARPPFLSQTLLVTGALVGASWLASLAVFAYNVIETQRSA